MVITILRASPDTGNLVYFKVQNDSLDNLDIKNAGEKKKNRK